MTGFRSSSSRLLKVGAKLARGALWLLAGAWLVLAVVWCALHFLIVPRIADFRPLLEDQASQATGIRVRIGAIAVQSNGLIPSFALTDITLHDAQGREALRLPSVVVALSPRSLLGLGFEQLYVDSPVLDVRRSADGQIWVAGFALPSSDNGNSGAAGWVFSQPEIAIRHGTVHWSDALRDAPTLTLTDVDLVLRNAHRGHALRLDASPPAQWGARFGVSAVFAHALLTGSAARWRDWDGQIHADFERVDLAWLRRYADLGVDVAQGAGGLRAWVDVRHAAWTDAVADVALTDVNATVDKRLEPVALRHVEGRLGVQQRNGGLEFFTEALQFETQDGLHWPGGNVRMALYPGDARNPARGELVADRLDLAAMSQIAKRLPLGDTVHGNLFNMDPKGLVERVQASWRAWGTPQAAYAVKGRVQGLELASDATSAVGRPGLRGATIDFDFNQSVGKATLAMQNGRLDFPGIFEEPQLPIDQLRAEVQWKRNGDQISVNLPSLRFSNADAEGEAQLKWQTGDAAHLFPGVLDLQGTLSRALAGRVHRYLPLPIDKSVREYVRTAIPSGSASGVKFKVKGKLQDFPFETAKQGDFRISTNLKDVLYDYAPASVLGKDSPPWPALTQASGELVVDRSVLQVNLVRANLAGGPGLRVGKVDGVVSHLYDGAMVDVSAEVQGPLAEGLAVVNASPLGAITGKALAQTTANGVADYRFRLGFPIAAVEKTTVRGSVVLAGNDLQITPDTPRLGHARGTVAFSEAGFSITGGQARALGGDVRIEGGLNTAAGSGAAAVGKAAMPTTLRLQGTVTAEGLQQASELALAARLGQYASGGAAYSVVLGLRAGTPELQISSNLVGMALRLPAPFAKAAETPLPLRVETAVLRAAPKPGKEGAVATQDQLKLDIGRLLNVVYQRDVTGVTPQVVRGAIAMGLGDDESAPLPDSGVVANINADSLDLDAWGQVLSQASGTALSTSVVSAPSAPSSLGYLPTTSAVRAKELVVGGRKLNNVVVGAARDDLLWRANLEAAELNGYVEYRQPNGPTPGRLYGRLARLVIAPSAAQDVENILDKQPASIPALDIVVDDFQLRGKKLGRVEINAVNLTSDTVREWRLNRFNIILPEAVLTASGNWTDVNAQARRSVARTIKDRRRTVLNFKLAIADAGALLERFGMKGVVRKGSGNVEGQVAWLGSPLTLDYPSLGGAFNVNVEGGQFLKTEPGIAKLLGVLSLQSLPRRLMLDFRDVFSEGFSFDFFRGDVAIDQGVARTSNLQMKGVNAVVLMDGQADVAKETQNIKVVVVPEINAGSASLLASIVNPVMGLSTFLAQAILRRPLMEAATQELLIDGTWLDPHVTKIDRKTGKPEGLK